LERSEWNEDEAIRFYSEHIEFLQEQKRKLEEAEIVNKLVMDYKKGQLTIHFNGKTLEIEDDKELLFRNIEIKIEKF
jgi:hypothetical protein